MNKKSTLVWFAIATLAANCGWGITGQEVKAMMDTKELRLVYSWQVHVITEAVINSRGPAQVYAYVFNKAPELTLKFMLGGGPVVVEGLGKDALLALLKDLQHDPEALSLAVANALMDQGLAEYRENFKIYQKWKKSGSLSDEEYEQFAKNAEGNIKLALGKALFGDVMSYKYDATARKAMQSTIISQADKVLELGGTLPAIEFGVKVAEIVDAAQKGLQEYPPWQKHIQRTKDMALEYPGMKYETPRPSMTALSSSPKTGPSAGEETTVDLGGGVSMTLCWCPPGTFMMGSPTDEAGRGNTEDQHRVTLSKGFWLGKYEVTQAQWEQVMGANPSNFKGATLPVEEVSWDDSQKFVNKLNASVLGGGFRLPTEAEWEYACRAGTTGLYAGNLDDMAWFKSNSGAKTHTVGQRKANAWSLHDMHGNVSEWCADRFIIPPTTSVPDPEGTVSQTIRVIRGGSWLCGPGDCRSAFREGYFPGNVDPSLGVRLVAVFLRDREPGQKPTVPITDTPAVAKPNLVAHYTLGTDARDTTGNGHDGSIKNAPGRTSGPIGGAMVFHGKHEVDWGMDGDHVLLPMLPFNDMQEFTVCLWVRQDEMMIGWGEAYIEYGDFTDGWLGINRSYSTDANTIDFAVGGTSDEDTVLRVPFDESSNGKFVHYGLVFKGGRLQAYRNATLIGEKNTTVKVAGKNAALGRHWWKSGERTSTRLNAAVADLCIYKQALTENELKSLFEAGNKTPHP